MWGGTQRCGVVHWDVMRPIDVGWDQEMGGGPIDVGWSIGT